MYTPNYKCDLHCHTNRSDGNDSVQQLIENAAAIGMEIIAIADHDVVPPATAVFNGKEQNTLDFAHGLGVKLLLGIEVSCDTQVEDVHIVGFGCNWSDPFFRELEEFTENSKIKGYQDLLKALSAHNITVSWEELLDNNGNPIPSNKIQKKMIFEMLAVKGYFPSWKDAKLAIKNTPEYNIKREKPDPISVIKGIHRSCGIAILAHPYLIDEKDTHSGAGMDRDSYIRRLISVGLDGIEASYTYDKTSYKGEKTKEEIYREVIERYGDAVKIISGGSDYHADDKKGVANPRRIGEGGVELEYFYSNSLLSKLKC